MVFFTKKRTKFEEMLDLEASCWTLIGNAEKIAISHLITSLINIVSNELDDLKQIEQDEKIQLGIYQKSQKVINLEKELIGLEQLLREKLKILNSDEIKSLSEEEIKKTLQGNGSEFSDVSMQIRKLLKIVKTDFNQLPTKIEKSRFIVEKDTIKDTKTGLIWDRDLSNSETMTWDVTMEYAKKQGKILPTRRDFQNLVDGDNFPIFEDLSKIGFIFSKNQSFFWTSEEYEEDTSYAWLVNFFYGSGNYRDKTSSYYVVCVRRD